MNNKARYPTAHLSSQNWGDIEDREFKILPKTNKRDYRSWIAAFQQLGTFLGPTPACISSSRGYPMPSSVPYGHCTRVVHRHTRRQNTHTQNK